MIKESVYKIVAVTLLLAVFFTPFFAFGKVTSNPDIPKIISRSEWGADESEMTWPVEYSKVEKFVVHHTASSKLIPDSDGSGEYKGMVKSIYLYHKGSKVWYDDSEEYTGFGDIGYNYLIDPNGNIYEGRAGGNGAIGGHVRGYNEGSVGIAVLGRYQGYYVEDKDTNKRTYVHSHPVTAAIKEALEKLIGWIAANNNVDLNKVSNFHGKNIDGVVGHRDLSATICPGDELYKELDNIQKNAIEYADKYKNYAYQIGGDKAVYIIEDGYKIRFDSVDKLPSAYKGRIIKPIEKSQLDAYRYKTITTYPDGTLLQKFDEPTVYYLENGMKRAMSMSEEEFVKMGFSSSDIKKVFASDLRIYKDGKIIKYGPDGSLIKDSKENVYLVENGKKRRFTSPKLFEYLGYKWKDIRQDNEADLYLDGPDMIYPDGTLITSRKDKKVYLVENRRRREISSDNLLKALGYKKEDVVLVTDDELNHFPKGKNLVYPDNTLVRADGSPTVYLIKDGKRKEFTSAVLFEKLGYRWNDIINTDASELESYPKEGRVLYPDGTLIKSTASPTVYLLENGRKKKILSLTLFKKRGYRWNDVISVSPDELRDYPDGGILTYPDGTLIKEKSDPVVYKVESGKRKEFTSPMLFKRLGGKWSDVIVVSKEELLAHVYDGVLKYPENTLLRKIGDSKVYVIKNGKAEWIKTADEFKRAGYKWKDVIEVTPSEMSLYIASQKKLQKNNSSDVDKEGSGGSGNSIGGSAGSRNNSIETGNSSAKATNGRRKADGAFENDPNIRIALYSTNKDDITITANGNYTVSYYNPDGTVSRSESKTAGEETTIAYFASSGYVKFTPSSRNVILQVLSYSDTHNPNWDKNIEEKYRGNDNRFRGSIEIRYSNTSRKLWVINELPLEDYLNGIAEATNDSPEEYLKAFSAVARTYAMYYIEKGGKYKGEPFHLKNSRNGNGNDQVYKGYNFEKRAPRIVSANKATFGYIITYRDKPIMAAYSSDSGGITKNGCEVLGYCGEDYAYLKGGVKDPEGTKHSENSVRVSHGVGMSAVGAYRMAVKGSSWQEIIKYYYPGVEIEK